jgi:hypothetical protein
MRSTGKTGIFDVNENRDESGNELPGTRASGGFTRPDAFVLFERGEVDNRIVHNEERVEQRKQEREMEALAGRYSEYVQTTDSPISFEQYVSFIRQLNG